MISEFISIFIEVFQRLLLSFLLYIYYNADLLNLIENKVNKMSLEFIDDIIYKVKEDMNIENIYKIKKILKKTEIKKET